MEKENIAFMLESIRHKLAYLIEEVGNLSDQVEEYCSLIEDEEEDD